MPTISIITPWSGNTGADLAGDYYNAVQGSAQVITVDNASEAATATILSEMTAHLAGEYIRNETNLGFAAANNQGYAKASGDVIIFLNSDVVAAGPWLAAVAADVKDGALYGPSLGSQLVAGRHIPYLEGWCLGATRATWERLVIDGKPHISDSGLSGWYLRGPWDADAYPGPYWEDNDLCLRALQAGLSLIQTAWPIQHKGGRTAGPIIRHGKSFAENERTFTQRVLAAARQPSMTDTWQKYMAAYHTASDIQHHLGLLYSLARGNVVELGTRTGVSTAALLTGVEERGGFVWSVDIDARCATLYEGHPQWEFVQSDSRNPELPARIGGLVDCLLIDTEHTFEQASAELALWSSFMAPGGHILLHDIETFPGVRRAVQAFCQRTGWTWTPVLPNNGMAVVEVPE